MVEAEWGNNNGITGTTGPMMHTTEKPEKEDNEKCVSFITNKGIHIGKYTIRWFYVLCIAIIIAFYHEEIIKYITSLDSMTPSSTNLQNNVRPTQFANNTPIQGFKRNNFLDIPHTPTELRQFYY
jgi:hypothetical protein